MNAGENTKDAHYIYPLKFIFFKEFQSNRMPDIHQKCRCIDNYFRFCYVRGKYINGPENVKPGKPQSWEQKQLF